VNLGLDNCYSMEKWLFRFENAGLQKVSAKPIRGKIQRGFKLLWNGESIKKIKCI